MHTRACTHSPHLQAWRASGWPRRTAASPPAPPPSDTAAAPPGAGAEVQAEGRASDLSAAAPQSRLCSQRVRRFALHAPMALLPHAYQECALRAHSVHRHTHYNARAPAGAGEGQPGPTMIWRVSPPPRSALILSSFSLLGCFSAVRMRATWHGRGRKARHASESLHGRCRGWGPSKARRHAVEARSRKRLAVRRLAQRLHAGSSASVAALARARRQAR